MGKFGQVALESKKKRRTHTNLAPTTRNHTKCIQNSKSYRTETQHTKVEKSGQIAPKLSKHTKTQKFGPNRSKPPKKEKWRIWPVLGFSAKTEQEKGATTGELQGNYRALQGTTGELQGNYRALQGNYQK